MSENELLNEENNSLDSEYAEDNSYDNDFTNSDSLDSVVTNPTMKEHKFSLIDSYLEFIVLITGILYTIWNCVDFINAIADSKGLSTIISSGFDVITKAIPFIILLVILECHEKLSYIEDNLSSTTDYIVDYNNHLDDELFSIKKSTGNRYPKNNKASKDKNNNRQNNKKDFNNTKTEE